MSRVKFAKGSEEWKLFMDFWELTQQLWGLEDTESYWEDVRARCEAYGSSYGDFGAHLAASLSIELKRRSEVKGK